MQHLKTATEFSIMSTLLIILFCLVNKTKEIQFQHNFKEPIFSSQDVEPQKTNNYSQTLKTEKVWHQRPKRLIDYLNRY